MAGVRPKRGRAVLTLDPLAEAVGRARRYVRAALQDLGRLNLEESAALGVSELVTNAAIHARTAMTVTVTVTDNGSVRIAVRDYSPALPRQRRHGAESTTGRGLRLVESLSTAWGVDPVQDAAGGGKVVWFEPSVELTDSGFAETDWLALVEEPL